MIDKYEEGRELGRGGMGAVYEGVHRVTGRKVAIKRITPELAGHPEVVGRFLREARAAAALDHPNVVQILDCGVDEGTPYLVMELLRGRSLAALLEEKGKLTPSEIYTLLRPVLGALERAHSLGMVHRDIKPENIFIAETDDAPPVAKLLDFGIARYYEAGDAERGLQRTQTGMVLGTPAFMSPEQAKGMRELDGRTDIYALGVVFYRALTGRLPHEQTSYNALIVAIVSERPPALRVLEPSVPEPIANAVMRALDSLDRRYATMREFRDTLDAVIPGVSAPRSARPPRPMETADTQLSLPPPAPMVSPTTPLSAWRWVPLGLLLMGLVAWVATSFGGATREPGVAAPRALAAPDAAVASEALLPPPIPTPPEEPPAPERPVESVPVRRRPPSVRDDATAPPEPATPSEPRPTDGPIAPTGTGEHRAGELDPGDFFR